METIEQFLLALRVNLIPLLFCTASAHTVVVNLLLPCSNLTHSTLCVMAKTTICEMSTQKIFTTFILWKILYQQIQAC